MYKLVKFLNNIGFYNFFGSDLFVTVKNGYKVIDIKGNEILSYFDESKSYGMPISTGNFLCFTDNDNGNLVVLDTNLKCKIIEGVFGTFGNLEANENHLLSYDKFKKKYMIIDLRDHSFKYQNFDYPPALFINEEFSVIHAGSNIWCYDFNSTIVWHIDLENFEFQIPEWAIEHEDHKGVKCKSEIAKWNDSLILSVGHTVFDQRFIIIDILFIFGFWIRFLFFFIICIF